VKRPPIASCGRPASRRKARSSENVNLDEVEQDRQRQARELAADGGEDWADQYRPGSAGCHELLDRTALLDDLLERHLLGHPACVARPDWYQLAERAAAALRELYQRVGAEHLTAEEPDDQGST
jgi:hypothetical protein